MWHNGVDALEQETMRLTAEIAAKDELGKTADIVRVVIEKTLQHAFIKQVSTSKLYRFDHEDFRSFYIGLLVGRTLAQGSKAISSLRAILDKGSLPLLATIVAAATVREIGLPEDWDSLLSELAELGARSSHLRENVGNLALIIVTSNGDITPRLFRSLLISGRTSPGRKMSHVTFVQCSFETVDFSATDLIDVVLDDCTLPVLTLDGSKRHACGLKLTKTVLPGKLVVKLQDGIESRELYSPGAIKNWFDQLGIQSDDPAKTIATEVAEEEEEIAMTIRALRPFARASGANESVLKARMGSQWRRFSSDVLPLLAKKHGVLQEVDYRGSGHQNKRFVLRVTFDKIEYARAHCDGKFEAFLALLDK
jgi:hypothetical protein